MSTHAWEFLPGAALNGKERVRSLLQRMEGCLRGARSLLPDFPHAPAPGEPLTVVGEVRACWSWAPKMIILGPGHQPKPFSNSLMLFGTPAERVQAHAGAVGSRAVCLRGRASARMVHKLHTALFACVCSALATMVSSHSCVSLGALAAGGHMCGLTSTTRAHPYAHAYWHTTAVLTACPCGCIIHKLFVAKKCTVPATRAEHAELPAIE